MLLLAVVASALMDFNIYSQYILDFASVFNRKLHLLPDLIMLCV